MVLLKQLNRPHKELLFRFWTDVVASLSFLSSLISLSTCPHSTPHHQFPVSTSASRCDYNDESVAAVCLCVWHCDVSLLALTLSLSLLCLPRFLCLSISFPFLSLVLSLSVMRYCLASCLSFGTYNSIQTHHHHQQQNNKQELSSQFANWFLLGAVLK